MFDNVSPQIWIALALAITALAPATYAWRYFTHGRVPRDITLPEEDLSWKSEPQLYRSLAILLGLIGIGVFIFTPLAEDFAKSDYFAPTLFGAMGSYAFGTAVSGWRSGEIEPLVRGVAQAYRKAEHPKRYWASLIWNGILGAALFTASLGVIYDNEYPDCNDFGERNELIEALESCNSMLAEDSLSPERRAKLLAGRGRVHHRLGKDALALRDYTGALQIDPEDSYALYNRAVIYEQQGNLPLAIEDFTASLDLRPDNEEAYLLRGLAYLDSGRFREATDDFTQLHHSDPDNPYALANRGIAHAWLGNRKMAELDFKHIREGDPGWPVVLRGQAVLAFQSENYPIVIRYLTQALEIDPEDYFALRMRADAYWNIGKHDLARDDDDRSMAIDAARRQVDIVTR